MFFSASRCCFFSSYVHSLRGTETEKGEQEEGFYVVGELEDGEEEEGGGERRRNEKRFRKERRGKKKAAEERERVELAATARKKKTYMRITTPQHSIYLTYPKYGSCQPTE